MNTKVKKILIISFYLVFLIVLGFILKDYFYTSDANSSTSTKGFDSEIESLVKQFYEKTDNEDYNGLSNITISGALHSEKNLKKNKYHSLDKILEKDVFIDKTLKGFDSEIESLVKQFYEKTDNGDYNGLSNIVISGSWFSEKNLKNPEYHSLDKILEKDEFIDKTLKEFGENGWRVQVITLDIINIEKISREALKDSFPRENELLDVIDKDKNTMELYLVEASGHRMAACGIADFKRVLPVMWQNNNWNVLLTGIPEYLDLLYRDQWFANLSF